MCFTIPRCCCNSDGKRAAPVPQKAHHGLSEREPYRLSDVDAFVGRGGSCYPVASGVYVIDDKLIEDTAAGKGGMEHPSNLGVQLARKLQKEFGGRIFMVDPPCVDELCDMARMTGIDGVPRHTNMHALNLRGVAMHHAKHVLGKSTRTAALSYATSTAAFPYRRTGTDASSTATMPPGETAPIRRRASARSRGGAFSIRPR